MLRFKTLITSIFLLIPVLLSAQMTISVRVQDDGVHLNGKLLEPKTPIEKMGLGTNYKEKTVSIRGKKGESIGAGTLVQYRFSQYGIAISYEEDAISVIEVYPGSNKKPKFEAYPGELKLFGVSAFSEDALNMLRESGAEITEGAGFMSLTLHEQNVNIFYDSATNKIEYVVISL